MSENNGKSSGGILIVEDSPVMIRTLTGLLKANNYTIAGIATDGIEAIKLFRDTSPAVVLMDINIPRLNGVVSMKAMLTMNPNAKVVIVSIASEKQMVLDAMAAGAKDYIIKPINPDRLCCVIDQLLAGE
ncbi:MAG: response regulator [bacterium]|nr:response regulator [bacterium]